MNYQDILINPNIKQDVLNGVTPSQLFHVPKDRWELVAVGYVTNDYVKDQAVSYCIAIINGRCAEFMMFSDSFSLAQNVGASTEEIPFVIPKHHFHVSRVNADPLPYAEALDVDEFFVRVSRNIEIILKKLPNWEVVERTDSIIKVKLKVR